MEQARTTHRMVENCGPPGAPAGELQAAFLCGRPLSAACADRPAGSMGAAEESTATLGAASKRMVQRLLATRGHQRRARHEAARHGNLQSHLRAPKRYPKTPVQAGKRVRPQRTAGIAVEGCSTPP